MMGAAPLSSFIIPVESTGLLGIPDNLKLQSLEKRMMEELIFTIALIACRCIGPAGLFRDVDVGCVGCTRGFLEPH